jgi:hypothetical protein
MKITDINNNKKKTAGMQHIMSTETSNALKHRLFVIASSP